MSVQRRIAELERKVSPPREVLETWWGNHDAPGHESDRFRLIAQGGAAGPWLTREQIRALPQPENVKVTRVFVVYSDRAARV